MDDFHPPSTATQLEASLDQAIEQLTRAMPSVETKRLLIEGKRLRSLMGNWRSIPPSQDVRREMLARVMNLAASAASASHAGMTLPPLSNAVTTIPAPPPQTPFTRAITQPSVKAVKLPQSMPRSLVADRISLVRPSRLASEQLEGVPGVDITFVPNPARGSLRCAIVKMQPGSELPARDLPGGEALYVVEGVALFGDLSAAAGEICHAEPDTVHVAIRTDQGCTLFIVAPDEDEETAP